MVLRSSSSKEEGRAVDHGVLTWIARSSIKRPDQQKVHLIKSPLVYDLVGRFQCDFLCLVETWHQHSDFFHLTHAIPDGFVYTFHWPWFLHNKRCRENVLLRLNQRANFVLYIAQTYVVHLFDFKILLLAFKVLHNLALTYIYLFFLNIIHCFPYTQIFTLFFPCCANCSPDHCGV